MTSLPFSRKSKSTLLQEAEIYQIYPTSQRKSYSGHYDTLHPFTSHLDWSRGFHMPWPPFSFFIFFIFLFHKSWTPFSFFLFSFMRHPTSEYKNMFIYTLQCNYRRMCARSLVFSIAFIDPANLAALLTSL